MWCEGFIDFIWEYFGHYFEASQMQIKTKFFFFWLITFISWWTIFILAEVNNPTQKVLTSYLKRILKMM